jgi:DNA repair exonuclease SbcCD nuclease subunit
MQPTFKFIHAADIHLDSPLRRLERYEGAPVARIRNAPRAAFEKLVNLALAEQVHCVLIAGDLYDGDLVDFSPLLYFSDEMARLGRQGIQVFLIRGNHDAANHMSRSLALPANVHLFSESKAETIRLDPFQVAVHGQSFAMREVRENLTGSYPDPVPGWFNIGMLHTSLQGSDRHDTYAPCSLDHLRQRGYDYWALGHIHQRELKHEARPVVLFPGNIQGRNVRETGPKGCHLIEVKNHQVSSNAFQPLDVMRWDWLTIDAAGLTQPADVLAICQRKLDDCVQQAQGRLLAVRVEITGIAPVHADLIGRREHWLNQFRSNCLNAFGQDLWLESLRLNTTLPLDDPSEALPADALDQLRHILAELASDDQQLERALQNELRLLDKRLPAALKVGDEPLHVLKPTFGRPLLSRVLPLLSNFENAPAEPS